MYLYLFFVYGNSIDRFLVHFPTVSGAAGEYVSILTSKLLCRFMIISGN